MKKILIFIIFFQFKNLYACKLEDGSLLLENNILVAQISFLLSLLILTYLYYVFTKGNLLKKIVVILLLLLIHPFLWYKNYEDCGDSLKYLSVVYSLILFIVLIVKKKRG